MNDFEKDNPIEEQIENIEKSKEKEKKIRRIITDIILILLVLIPLIVFFYLVFFQPALNTSIYNNIPIDSKAQKVSDAISSSLNKASFEFSKNVVFTDKLGTINFKNPADATQSIVLELFISDAELKQKIGKTGRKVAEQNNLEKQNYDPTKAKVSVGKSGCIPPGYNLGEVQLSSLPDGTELPGGIYKATVDLTLYNSSTNERSMVNSQLNITILVK